MGENRKSTPRERWKGNVPLTLHSYLLLLFPYHHIHPSIPHSTPRFAHLSLYTPWPLFLLNHYQEPERGLPLPKTLFAHVLQEHLTSSLSLIEQKLSSRPATPIGQLKKQI